MPGIPVTFFSIILYLQLWLMYMPTPPEAEFGSAIDSGYRNLQIGLSDLSSSCEDVDSCLNSALHVKRDELLVVCLWTDSHFEF